MSYSAGKHWSALGVPVAEPYQPPGERRPGGWPKTGIVGAKASLGDDEHPVTVGARPYRLARVAGPEPTEAQTVAVRVVHDAIDDAVHRGLLARAIGWFRR